MVLQDQMEPPGSGPVWGRLAGPGIHKALSNTCVPKLSGSLGRVMAAQRWAVHSYCRITERLIETNGSNNGTLSPQAGFVLGLISVAVVAPRTSHRSDPSKEAAEASFKSGILLLAACACARRVQHQRDNVNMSRHPRVPLGPRLPLRRRRSCRRRRSRSAMNAPRAQRLSEESCSKLTNE